MNRLRTISESMKHITESADREISSLTEDEKGEMWALIGGTPHLFNDEEFMNWMENGEVPDGITLGALEIVRLGEYLKSKGFNGDAKGKW